jgi:hypothetical protein
MNLKKIFNPKWMLILLMGLLTSQYIRDIATGRETFFVWKWLNNDLEYAKHIHIETYLLTDDQLKDFILDPEQQIIQPTWRELHAKLVNRVVRIKNNGPKKAWGNLLLYGSDGVLLPIDLSRMENDLLYKGSYIFIVPNGSEYDFKREIRPPSLNILWKELYTKSVK